MQPAAETVLHCDTMVQQWAVQLASDNLEAQQQARRRINYWLDRRLELMGERGETCSSSQRSQAA